MRFMPGPAKRSTTFDFMSTITLKHGVVAVDGEPYLKFDSNCEAAAFLILRCKLRYVTGSFRAGDNVALFERS